MLEMATTESVIVAMGPMFGRLLPTGRRFLDSIRVYLSRGILGFEQGAYGGAGKKVGSNALGIGPLSNVLRVEEKCGLGVNYPSG
jgi:hypothetical protein